MMSVINYKMVDKMLSVIIPTRNRAELLDFVLNSLRWQTLSSENYEVLIIDNGSTDNTISVTQKYSALLTNIKYFYETEPGLHVGRHRGMFEAKSDILVFADDDIEALPTWLESIQEAFLDPDVAMVGGNNLPMFLTPPPRWLQNMWDRTHSSKMRALPALSILEMGGSNRDFSPYFVFGCNFSIRRQVLLEVGGFHPDGMPKELIRYRGDGETHVSRYVLESGKRCVFHPGASVYHKVMPERMTFEYFRQRGFNQGISISYTELRGERVRTIKKKRMLLRRIVSPGKRQIKNIISLGSEVNRALDELQRGCNEGYAYHQQMYRDHADVRDWVHKSKYYKEND